VETGGTCLKKSELEQCFEINFVPLLKKHGFDVQSEVVLAGARYRYDYRFEKPGHSAKFVLEIDGNGMGHSSVAAKARDAEKSNHALWLGYRPLRLTTKHFRRVQKVLVPADYAHNLIDDVVKGVYR